MHLPGFEGRLRHQESMNGMDSIVLSGCKKRLFLTLVIWTFVAGVMKLHK